jgi:hypothetical protein
MTSARRFLFGLSLLGALAGAAQANAIGIVPAPAPSPGFEIDARARNGNTGFEGILFTPGNPAGVQLNPSGAPAWNYGLFHDFAFLYQAATGTATWSIDFHSRGIVSATSVSPTLAGMSFQYVNLFVQGGTQTATVQNLSINGVLFPGPFVSSSDTAFEQWFTHTSGLFEDIHVTGALSFSGAASQERPRVWVRLASPEDLPAPVPEPSSMALAATGLLAAAFVGWRRRKGKA